MVFSSALSFHGFFFFLKRGSGEGGESTAATVRHRGVAGGKGVAGGRVCLPERLGKRWEARAVTWHGNERGVGAHGNPRNNSETFPIFANTWNIGKRVVRK